MDRQAPAAPAPASDRTQAPAAAARRGRRATAFRLVTMLALAVGTVLLLAACGEEKPYSHVTPKTENARDIQFLYKVLFWMALVVFVGVQALIFYTALRFKRRDDDRPEQIHGNKRLEITWTIVPAIVLLIIFVPTAQALYDFDNDAVAGDMEIDVYGKQWWWEAHYPGIQVAGPEGPKPLVTANEIRIPAGREVVFNLRSNNVIHSFWVPQLTGKLDLIPGHNNRLSVKAEVPGEYWGECAEFCGAAHAWMRFKVIVEPQANFDAWVAAYQQPPTDADPATADVVEVAAAFRSAGCIACHNVNGTNAQLAGEGIEAYPLDGGPGPNLTLLGCRDMIAAGLLPNTAEGLETWIKHTDEVKPGTHMPNYYEQGAVDDAGVDEIVQYLLSLKPAGGCPPEQPIGGEVPTDAASDEANP